MKKACIVIFSFLIFQCHAQDSNFQHLFNGKNLDGWKVVAGSARYIVEDNAIVGITEANSPNSFLATDKEYGDFELELDVMLSDTTLNSGVQFRSHVDIAADGGKGAVYGYQCEEDPQARRWSGGIYEERGREWLYPLTLNPEAMQAFKVGEYNHYRIEAIGNTIKTWVNGIPASYLVDSVSHDGFIALQVHAIPAGEMAGKKVYWKNIQINTNNPQSKPFPDSVFIVNMIPNTLSPEEKVQGWNLLFDGKSTAGWVGAYKETFPENGWEVKDGELTVLSSEGKEAANGGDIVTTKEYSAFDMTFQYKLTPGANSGVKYFVTLKENNKGSAIGLEYQLLDDDLHPDAKLGRDGNRTLSSLYDLITANKQPNRFKKPGNWNWGRIIVYPNNHVEHWLNGLKVLEYERGSQSFKDLVAISKYKVWENFGEAPKGHILLQDHGNEVSFRSIKIRELN